MLLYYLTLFIVFEGLIILWNHYFIYLFIASVPLQNVRAMREGILFVWLTAMLLASRIVPAGTE